ncbi:MAG: dihydroneopterin aldolase, partial [bacterium]
ASKHITENRFHLLESLTETLADAIYNVFKPYWVCVRVRKLSPPFPGQLDYVELEVLRGERVISDK